MVHCPRCKTDKRRSQFALSSANKNGLQGYCIRCQKDYDKAVADKRVEAAKAKRQRQKLSPNYRAGVLCRCAKKRAKHIGVRYDLTQSEIAEIIKRGVCERTGIPFQLNGVGAKPGRSWCPWSPSLDRINSNAGYTKENVQVVVWLYNLAKGPHTDGELLELARAIVKKADRFRA